MTARRLKPSAWTTDLTDMERERGYGGVWHLAAALYAAVTGLAAGLSVGWVMAPIENAEENTRWEVALVGLALLAFVAGSRMAFAVWSGDSSSARLLLVASLGSLAVWALLLSPG
ncbi:MAG: hypothetical protein ACRDPL_16930 [Propionibacteriaceae bacterium]